MTIFVIGSGLSGNLERLWPLNQMSRLSRHISELLLRSECVTVPSLGAFLRLYVPSRKLSHTDGEVHLSSPSYKLGFNALIKDQDGLLQSSYRRELGTDYQTAGRILDKDIRQLRDEILLSGQAHLDDLGILRSDITGTLRFIPESENFMVPGFYGMQDLSILTLEAIRKEKQRQKAIEVSRMLIKEKTQKTGSSWMRPWMAVASTIAVILTVMTFLMTANSDLSDRTSQASLFPAEAVTSSNAVAVSPAADAVSLTESSSTESDSQSEPVPNQASAASSQMLLKHYHVIVASVSTESEAVSIASDLIQRGASEAKVIMLDGRIRVAYTSCASQHEAEMTLKDVQRELSRPDAWILRR